MDAKEVQEAQEWERGLPVAHQSLEIINLGSCVTGRRVVLRRNDLLLPFRFSTVLREINVQ